MNNIDTNNNITNLSVTFVVVVVVERVDDDS